MKGKIFLDNREIDTFSNNEIARRIAVVSQSLPVVDMTAKEFVLLGRIPYRKGLQFFEDDHDLSVAQEAMLMTDMKRLEDDYLSGMSGGEVQLAFIARAIAQEPLLLLLDEPTSHLDITHQVSILDLIRRLNRRQDLTVVITLHDLNLASEYCDRLALMDNGRIRHLGTPEEVLTYRNIEEAYDTVVVVEKNPLSGKPFVLVASEEIREKCKR
jgi:iron complex transport system ATP-binding protein